MVTEYGRLLLTLIGTLCLGKEAFIGIPGGNYL